MITISRMGFKVEIDSFFSDKQDNSIYVLTKTLQQSKQLEEKLRKGVKEGKTFGWCINTLKGTQNDEIY